MPVEQLSFLFQVMVYVGLGLPLLNLLLGAFTSSGGGEADVDLDASLDVEMDLDMDLDAAVDLVDALDVSTDLDEIPVKGASVGQSRSPVQFNLYCLCLALVIMGCVGVFAVNTADNFFTMLLTLAVGLVAALTGYILLYRLVVRKLKQNDASALNMRKLLHQHARVTFRILMDSPGKIQAKDSVGAFITYAAHLDKDVCLVDRINEGEEVIITEIDPQNQVCYVALAERKIL